MSEAATLTTEVIQAATPLASQLQSNLPDLLLTEHSGSLTPKSFALSEAEITAALSASACFDIGYRTRIRVTGEDRLRWLNGMVSNAIQALPEGNANYNFILNAQGRIQGDAYIARRENDLLLDTDRSQAARLIAHLDHFIIMDDVELHPLDDAASGIGLAGPQAATILDGLGLKASDLKPLEFLETSVSGIDVTLLRGYSVHVPRFELWCSPENALALWTAVSAAGAFPIGIDTVEALRVLDGTLRFGIDITDRHLPQETAQTRALNFSKGCYLGQEIVERIRSRATVHRTIRQFQLDGALPSLPAELRAESDPAGSPTPVGQLTSVAEIRSPHFNGIVAIGSIRTEALERKSPIVYEGGTAAVFDSSPLTTR